MSRQVGRCGGVGGTDGGVLGVDAGVQQSLLPTVQVVLRLAGQFQAAVVLVHIPARNENTKKKGKQPNSSAFNLICLKRLAALRTRSWL